MCYLCWVSSWPLEMRRILGCLWTEQERELLSITEVCRGERPGNRWTISCIYYSWPKVIQNNEDKGNVWTESFVALLSWRQISRIVKSICLLIFWVEKQVKNVKTWVSCQNTIVYFWIFCLMKISEAVLLESTTFSILDRNTGCLCEGPAVSWIGNLSIIRGDLSI